jgi:hypothetical protein
MTGPSFFRVLGLSPSPNQKTNSEFSFSTTQPDTPSGAKKGDQMQLVSKQKKNTHRDTH